MLKNRQVQIDDTYAEAFRSIYAEFLITARDRKWLDHAVCAGTGNASSAILCDCEGGMDRYVGPGGVTSPSRRPMDVPVPSCTCTFHAFARTGSPRLSGRCWCALARMS